MTTLPEEAVKAEIQLDPNAVIAAVRECARITAPDVTDAEFEALRADNDPLYANTTRDMERAIRAYLSALPFLPVQGASAAREQALEDHHDLTTHYNSWRKAMHILEQSSATEEDRLYWKHELNAFDRAIAAAIRALANVPAPSNAATDNLAAQPVNGLARKLHGPFGYIVGQRDMKEDSWRLEDDPVEDFLKDQGFFSVPLYALTDPFKEIGIPQPDPIHTDAGKSVEGDGWHVEYEVYSEDEWQAASTDLDGALDYAVMYEADGFKNITVQEVRRRTLPSAPSEGAE